jgi:hypothetical protein
MSMSDILLIGVALLGVFGVYVLLVCKDYNEKEINK